MTVSGGYPRARNPRPTSRSGILGDAQSLPGVEDLEPAIVGRGANDDIDCGSRASGAATFFENPFQNSLSACSALGTEDRTYSQMILERVSKKGRGTTRAQTTINVVVRPAPNDGWFDVFYTGKRLCISQFPLRDVGRGFLARGYKPRPSSPSSMVFPGPR